MMIELVLGGAKCGKTRYAEQRAAASGKQVIYIATAEAGDIEMTDKIRNHQQDRPKHWKTIEEPIKLADTIQNFSTEDSYLLVDCLTCGYQTSCLVSKVNCSWMYLKKKVMLYLKR